MEMDQLIRASPPREFNFDSGCTTPYLSAPSSPQRFGTFFFSAPTSPTRISALYGGGDTTDLRSENPESPRPKETDSEKDDDLDDDFAFDFSGQLERSFLSAADAGELFDGGKIKPLKPQSQLQNGRNSIDFPKSPKRIFKKAFSPSHRKKKIDPFVAESKQSKTEHPQMIEKERRGRERSSNSTNSPNSRLKGTRSLSPLRVSDLLFDQEGNQENTKNDSVSSSSSSSVSSLISVWYNKWKLKDLLLFRSASEGRSSNKEQLKRYVMLKKTHEGDDDVKNSSFRSIDSVGSSVSRSKRRGPVSAHELHYTMNRAMSEEMKRKTFLPYKQGLLGCLGFNAAIHDSFSNKSSASVSMSRRH